MIWGIGAKEGCGFEGTRLVDGWASDEGGGSESGIVVARVLVAAW